MECNLKQKMTGTNLLESGGPEVSSEAVRGDTNSSRPGGASSQVGKLFADLFTRPQPAPQTPSQQPIPSESAAPTEAVRTIAASVAPPRIPGTLAESGLQLSQIADLVLKQLYLHGTLLGGDVARATRLPFALVDEALRVLREQKCIEIASGDLVGRVSFRFALT